jgi:hypothetical protein
MSPSPRHMSQYIICNEYCYELLPQQADLVVCGVFLARDLGTPESSCPVKTSIALLGFLLVKGLQAH